MILNGSCSREAFEAPTPRGPKPKPKPKAFTQCPDCGAAIGNRHTVGCQVEQCPSCGGQLLSCGCGKEEHLVKNRIPWQGEWSGEAECREFGWYAKYTREGWTPCEADDPNAGPDLNRLYVDAVWDAERQRFVKKDGEAEQ